MAWFPKKCVVVPIDFSDQSFEALGWALQMVEEPSQVRLIHVLPSMDPGDPGVIWQTLDNESRSLHAEKALRERLEDSKYEGVGIDVTFGESAQEIVDFALRVGAELIVLPSHGRTGLSRLLIGSVAERVVRLAHCPVLVLRS